MKKNILPIFLCLLTLPCFAEYIVEGGKGKPYLVEDNAKRIQVYLLNGLDNAKITFTSNSSENHKWYKYVEKASNGVKIDDYKQLLNTSYITDISDGTGYYVGEPTDPLTSYIWIIDYSRYIPVFNSLTIDDELEDRCEMIKLLVDINAPQLYYYTYNGEHIEIPRSYKLSYYTMKWSDAHRLFISSLEEDEKIRARNGVTEHIIDAPLQDTDFTFSGDQFAEYFKIRKTMKSEEYKAIAVSTEILIDTLSTTSENEMIDTKGSLSAPAAFTYTAYANEPVATFYIWKIYNLDRSITNPVTQTTNKILHYTFEEAGRYRVDLEVSDRQSICTHKTTLSDIFVSDFKLWVPNAFSPTSSPGINDVFKVAYKSVVKFNGWIFNRWGNELFHWTDPSQGWDGRYRGKYVPPGTYFYVIEATDANGKKHVRKGDVNIAGGK